MKKILLYLLLFISTSTFAQVQEEQLGQIDASKIKAPTGTDGQVLTIQSGVVVPLDLPAISNVKTYQVASQVAMLALTKSNGNETLLAIRSDNQQNYVCDANCDATILAQWKILATPNTTNAFSLSGQVLTSNVNGISQTQSLATLITTATQTELDAKQVAINTNTTDIANLTTEVNTKQDALTGNESVFNGWDDNKNDDFSGDYNDLTNIPTGGFIITSNFPTQGMPNWVTPTALLSTIPDEGTVVEIWFDVDSDGNPQTLDVGFGAYSILYTDASCLDCQLNLNHIRKNTRYLLIWNNSSQSWHLLNHSENPIPVNVSELSNDVGYITSNAVNSVAGKTGTVTLVKADVGLSAVDNTTDLNKPISTATQTALNTKWGITGNSGTSAATNFIGTTDANDFVAKTNNTERLRITSGGDIGIGTATPTQRLDVVGGNIRISNPFSILGRNATNTADITLAQVDAANIVKFGSNAINTTSAGGLNTLYVQGNNGNVGIGTTTPTSKLFVKSADNVATTEIATFMANNSTYGVGITYNGIKATGSNAANILYLDSKSTGYLLMQTNATGNVGIGTTAPTSNIHINGSEAGSITTITATTTLDATHHKVLVSNAAVNITITLPNALTCLGREYIISRAAGSTGTITVQGTGTNAIQALNGTTWATTSIGLHSATGGGLNQTFTAVNIAGIGYWIRF